MVAFALELETAAISHFPSGHCAPVIPLHHHAATPVAQRVEEHLWLVASEARRLARRLPHNVQAEDLVGAGCMGLMHAVRSYDSARGTEFPAYARFRIRGAMLDELRELDVLPRRARSSLNRLERNRRTFQAAHGREPTSHELASAARMTDRAVDQLLLLGERAQTAQPVDAVDPLDQESSTALEQVERREAVQHLAEAMGRLSPRQQEVLAAYYQRDLTFREIGASWGVTESRICQLHAEAVQALRKTL